MLRFGSMSAMNLHATYRLADKNRFRICGEEGLILRQDVGEVIAVNELGAVVLDRLVSNKTPDDIIKEAVTLFDVEPAQIQADIIAFVQELENIGIVVANRV